MTDLSTPSLFDVPSTPSSASPEPGFDRVRAIALKRAREACPGKRVYEVVDHRLQMIYHIACNPDGGASVGAKLLLQTNCPATIDVTADLRFLIDLERDDPRIPPHDPEQYVLLMPPRAEPMPAKPTIEDRAAA